MGSIHHAHTIPIDFDRATYEKARTAAGGTDERLFEDYFDEQYDMLQKLKPPVVGHFDLIRLLSDHRDADFEGMGGVWERMRRNLQYIASYGGVLELNSAGLRKGLAEPYPCSPVCLVRHTASCARLGSLTLIFQAFLDMGGRFAMSDDSHGTDQVGTNYTRLLNFIQKLGVKEVFYVDRDATTTDERFAAGFSSVAVNDLIQSPFWKTAK